MLSCLVLQQQLWKDAPQTDFFEVLAKVGASQRFVAVKVVAGRLEVCPLAD